jgi:hypothetical protein
VAEPTPPHAAKAQRRFLDTDPRMIETFGDPFRPLEPECTVVQFNRPLTQAQLAKAGELMRGRPDVELYVYDPAGTDLDFLKFFPALRRLHLSLYRLEDIAGFAHLDGSLEELVFAATRKGFSLGFLDRFPRLSKLFLQRHRKDLRAVERLAGLTSLGLSGLTLPDLSLALPLTGLRSLSILLGGTTNLALLPRLPALESLFLMRITKLADVSVLGELANLKTLRLDWMRNVTSLPSFAGLARLESVTLDTMKGVADLAPVAAAPALRRPAVTSMPQLGIDAFRCLLGHASLAELWAYTGRQRVNDAVKAMFPGIAR